ncbi:MAG: SPOR domain-containing protein [Candidatus Marinimicrobia bacterium]|nr:SPOR domain-containing protein [Candidatus Neomarinimicrobiota bacterium]MDD4961034.1 SPOR domain-containing protein [Candidatus Neomarinimicrobiota bacterium]MDD5709130.1 SPOR domain-containing protein [Candidatus Neomarinimicrobiota bacterium]
MKKICITMFLFITGAATSAQVFQQEFLDPADLRTPYRLKEFKTILHSEETVFPKNIRMMEREYIETQGYRIQLISTQDRNEAMRIKTQADARYDLPVYIDFEPPNYKVRIGNYASQEEAMRNQEHLQRQGFKFAWVVPSKIIIPK